MKRKAISPVIATLLLILIAIAASILVYVWVTGYASSITGAETIQLQERIKVDAVSAPNGTAGANVTIYVRNIGNVEVNVTSAYIIDSITSAVVGYNDTNCTLATGQVRSLNVTLTSNLTVGRTYIAKVVTKNGVEATYSFVYRE